MRSYIDLFSGVANAVNIYPPGASTEESVARVHGITDLDGECSFEFPASYGYNQVVPSLGGVLGSVCAGSGDCAGALACDAGGHCGS